MSIQRELGKSILWGISFLLLPHPSRCGEGDLKSFSPTLEEKLDLSEEAKRKFEETPIAKEEGLNFYSIIGQDCSWYCGGRVSTVTASSSLADAGAFTYGPRNAHDDSVETAWVEGADGPGVGEWIEYEAPPQKPRITTVNIYNGMVKSDALWKANGRVKRLGLSINGKPHAVLNLKDTPAKQVFKLGTLEPPDAAKPLVLRFTIEDVYPGTKHKDTALTELYFDGVGVH